VLREGADGTLYVRMTLKLRSGEAICLNDVLVERNFATTVDGRTAFGGSTYTLKNLNAYSLL